MSKWAPSFNFLYFQYQFNWIRTSLAFVLKSLKAKLAELVFLSPLKNTTNTYSEFYLPSPSLLAFSICYLLFKACILSWRILTFWTASLLQSNKHHSWIILLLRIIPDFSNGMYRPYKYFNPFIIIYIGSISAHL